MRRIAWVLVVIVVLLLTSCVSAKEKTFSTSGVTFVCPAKWDVTDVMDMEGVVLYLTVESKNEKAAGLVSISLFRDTFMDFDECMEFMNSYFEDFDEEGAFHPDEVRDDAYGIYPAKTQNYVVEYGDEKAAGRLVAFHVGENTVCLVEQSAVDHASELIDDFWRIESTLSIETEE